MNKNEIKILIRETHKYIKETILVTRPMEFDPKANYVLVGIRRAGKSYMMLQDIKQRISQGEITLEDCLMINFEDERLSSLQASELGIILDCYAEMFGNRRPLVYLDEIQNIEGWEKFARRLADQHYRVMITGSNAKMLSKEIATTLGGRFIVREVLPFSYEEYLFYHDILLTKDWQFDPDLRLSVIRNFEDYFRNGGFAEAFTLTNKREYINSLYQKILLGDIIARNKIRGDRTIRLLTRKLAENVMQPTALSRFQHIIKSAGESITIPTIKDYLQFMEQSYLIFSLPNFASPLSEQETIKKRYFYDNAILNCLTFNAETRLLENLCAITLLRTYNNTDEPRLFYYNRNIEVDFYVPESGLAVQASYDIMDDNTREREVNALRQLHRAFGLQSAIIVTYDHEETIHTEDIDIQVIPIWKWILSNSAF